MRLLLILLFIPSICLSKEVRIAVLDTGLTATKGVKLCRPIIDLTKTNTKSEFNYHGDNVTHIISDGLKNYCIIHIKVSSEIKKESYYVSGIYEAIRLGADIINISGGGPGASVHELAAVRYAEFKHIIIVAAAGNDGKDLDKGCYYYPACYASVVVIGNKHKSSNYGNKVNKYMRAVNVKAGDVTLTGTSQAAAMFTHELVKRMEPK